MSWPILGFPGGLFGVNSNGKLTTQTVTIRIRQRLLMASTGWRPGPLVSSPRCQVTLMNGDEHSKAARHLNPSFTDWIMGWPTGWTDPLRPVTGWCHWQQLARGVG